MTTMHDIIGVNTHMDFSYDGSPYIDQVKVIKCIKYLGVKHLRDGAGKPDTCARWIKVAHATGTKFCAYLPNGSPAFVAHAFTFWPELYRNGLIDMFEAPNEPDKPYSINLGNSIEWCASFTRDIVSVYTKSRGKDLVNLSVGAGWIPPLWEGNYKHIPNMTKYCDRSNPHVYPNPGQDVLVVTKRLIELAQFSMPGAAPVITELGWALNQGHTDMQIAADIIKVAQSNVAPRIYIYALFDDQSGKFGLFDDDGTPRAGATAIHNLLG